ncbi:MAG: ATP-binding protein [Proteiniphilum sp.]|nr:ATP-binding protein [Proteiniphilum sp.]MDD4158149.1 ATP-binding protein [Proteiniphilum sp.]MDD4800938.1 ATP-binding protein [Proteiniphilum sp.]
MGSNSSPEHRIRIKVGLILLVVTLYFAGLFVYSGRVREEIRQQQQEMEQSRELVSLNNRLILSVQHAQDMLNRYLLSPHKKWHQEYDSLSTAIERQMLAVKKLSADAKSDLLLEDVDSLLQKKRQIGERLALLIRSQNPLSSLDRKIETYEEMVRDTVVVTTSQDTVRTRESRKKNFWGRLKNLFDPEHAPDTTVTIAHVQQEAWSASRLDTVIYSDLKEITREASQTYSSQMAGIEQQVSGLIFAEQNISLRISQLITQYYHEAMKKSKEGADRSEALTRRIFTFALTVGILSILLILFIVLLIADDLNKGQKARRDLIREQQRSEQLIESRHKLLLSVSHDIKTPLSSMMGYIEMWENDEMKEERKQELRSARSSARHILSMLANLLEFSRLERNRGSLRNGRFEMNELMQDILGMFRPLSEEKGLQLLCENHLPRPFVTESDQTLLRQILVNVISNGVKYTREGSVTIALRYGEQLIITVTDTGTGISEQDQKEIFKPFSRVGDPSKTEGSGFGLYVTQGLTKALKGEIMLSSEKGKGTRVEIRLPLSRIEGINEAPVTDSVNPGGATAEKILIFEDDPSLGHMLREYLTRQGCKVKLCGDARDVKGFVRLVSSFDLVISDLQMREVSGTGILRAIRERDPLIPVWLMTAHDDYTPERAAAEGFAGLLPKPVHLDKLRALLTGRPGEERPVPAAEDPFPGLTALFGDDRGAIREILAEFVESSDKDMEKLSELIDGHCFREAQQLCHRIHPFYCQLGAKELTETLRRMDSLRGKEEDAWPKWKEELRETVQQVRLFTAAIRHDHL